MKPAKWIVQAVTVLVALTAIAQVLIALVRISDEGPSVGVIIRFSVAFGLMMAAYFINQWATKDSDVGKKADTGASTPSASSRTHR